MLRDELALGEGAVGWVAQHREPILWTEAVSDPRFLDGDPMRQHGLRWMTAYPIAIGDRMLGAFAVHRASALPITPETSTLMGSLAAQAAIALENAHLYSETSRRLTETRALLEVAEILSATLDSRRLLKRVDAEGRPGLPRRPLHARAVGRRPRGPADVAVRRRPQDARACGSSSRRCRRSRRPRSPPTPR